MSRQQQRLPQPSNQSNFFHIPHVGYIFAVRVKRSVPFVVVYIVHGLNFVFSSSYTCARWMSNTFRNLWRAQEIEQLKPERSPQGGDILCLRLLILLACILILCFRGQVRASPERSVYIHVSDMDDLALCRL